MGFIVILIKIFVMVKLMIKYELEIWCNFFFGFKMYIINIKILLMIV